jgi:DNA-binding transcriptional ArsR family regulator
MPIRCEPPEDNRETVKSWRKAMKFTPDLDERAALLRAIAQPTRLRLFYLLDKLGSVCVCDLGEILGVTQSAISQHLAKFKACGLVSVRRDAQTLYYSLADKPDVKRLRKLAVEGIESEV